ncbi:MAG TPA: threonine--tRNA ligase [Longimicrobium sp.]|jgi:threonyl-tRNA synthetase|uniref:threonine--tRNA ligase n=1 Tax=Longimicrobium sp. TaxID=2029185 RepID=UPI002ED85855
MTDWNSWLQERDWQPVPPDEFKALPADEKLRRIRHSSAHVMATALRGVRPEATFAIGPATEHGFFYDVHVNSPLTPDELAQVQEGMKDVSRQRQKFERAVVPHAEAVEFMRDRGERFKLEILEKLADQTVTFYRNGDFVDLCAGPHVPDTSFCQNVKLLAASPAHWRGEQNPSLQRVSGTAWDSRDALKSYLAFVEEAKARDHRVLGQTLDLFSFHPWAAGALWHPRGLVLRNELAQFWRGLMPEYGYQEILNPVLYKPDLFHTSGHWEHYHEDMFIVRDEEGEPDMVLKPMNCPDTMLYYKTRAHSYRDLPLRIAEGQVLHRNEVTGALHGLMRTRSFVQDDAHIFLTPEQVQDEILQLLELVDRFYTTFGLEYVMKLSTRPEKYMGELETWNAAEAALSAALTAAGRDFTVDEGDGAFYGPKIDISIQDSLGRKWQCGTIQLDFQLPQRFDLEYTAQDGTRQRPIVIHRAIFGSMERFIGVIVEHFAGAFPLWLAPVQAVVLPISDEKHLDYAREVTDKLRRAGIRTELQQYESLNYRVRQAEKQKVPYILVVGEREQEQGTAAVRRHKVKEQRVAPVDEVIAELVEKIRTRELDVHQTRMAATFQETAAATTTDSAY